MVSIGHLHNMVIIDSICKLQSAAVGFFFGSGRCRDQTLGRVCSYIEPEGCKPSGTPVDVGSPVVKRFCKGCQAQTRAIFILNLQMESAAEKR